MPNIIKQTISRLSFLALFLPTALFSQTEAVAKTDSVQAIVENQQANTIKEFGAKMDTFFLLLHSELAEHPYHEYLEGNVLCYDIESINDFDKEKFENFFRVNTNLLKSLGLSWSTEESLNEMGETNTSFLIERKDKTIIISIHL